MSKYELVFIPSPGISHLVSTVEIAKLLLRDQRLFVTVLIMKLPNDQVTDNYTRRVSSNASLRLRFIDLPVPESSENNISAAFVFDCIDSQIVHVREVVSSILKNLSEANAKLAGLALDMFCINFTDVADEFETTAYAFFTSGASGLGVFRHLASLKFEHNQELSQFQDSDAELQVPSFAKPVPAKVFPNVFVRGGALAERFVRYAKSLKEVKGIMINTFYELETFATDSMRADDSCLKVYPVGPILNSNTNSEFKEKDVEIMKWLDGQPENSVLFLCFGSMGSFEEAQIKEIAKALENSGQRFLRSLRKPVGNGKDLSFLTDYEDFQVVLPDGFLARTKDIGKLIGWAPQMTILSHRSVGGFISHCGWNSTLESIWFGVPMATFPLYAEQQQNAFLLIKEFEIAEEIRIDYRMHANGGTPPEIVGSEEIELAIRRLMRDEPESSVRRKVQEMKEKSRSALMEGGSSYMAQNLFIVDVIRNID